MALIDTTGIRPIERRQPTEDLSKVRRREEGTSGAFRPQTNVALKTAIQDLAATLSKISSEEKYGVQKLPKEVSDIVKNILRQSFSMDSTLNKGIGSTIESQRFSMDQLMLFSRMLSQMGTLAEKGYSMKINDETQLLMTNLKNIIVAEAGGEELEPVLMMKSAFDLVDAKVAEQLPQALYELLAQLANISLANQQQQQPPSEGMQFLKQLIRYFIPRPEVDNQALKQEQKNLLKQQKEPQNQQGQQGQQTRSQSSSAQRFLDSMFKNFGGKFSQQQAQQSQPQGQQAQQSQPQGQQAQFNQPQGQQAQFNQPQGQQQAQFNQPQGQQQTQFNQPQGQQTQFNQQQGQQPQFNQPQGQQQPQFNQPQGQQQPQFNQPQGQQTQFNQPQGQQAQFKQNQPQGQQQTQFNQPQGQQTQFNQPQGQQTQFNQPQGQQAQFNQPQGQQTQFNQPQGQQAQFNQPQGQQTQFNQPQGQQTQFNQPQGQQTQLNQNQPQGQQQAQFNQNQPQGQQTQFNQPQGQQTQLNQNQPQGQQQAQFNQNQPQGQQTQLNQNQPQGQQAQFNQPQSQQTQFNQPQGQQTQFNQPQGQQQAQFNQPQGQQQAQFNQPQGQQQAQFNQPQGQQAQQSQPQVQQQISKEPPTASLPLSREFISRQKDMRRHMDLAKNELIKTQLQNTPETTNTMKNLAQFLMRNTAMTPRDTALLQNFVNNSQQMMSETDARHLQNLLRLCQQNIPLTVRQAAVQQNLPDLPRLWAFMQMCDMANVTSKMNPKAFKRAGKDVAAFATAMRQAMSSDNAVVQNQRSFQMMIPLYMGDNEASYPTYFNIYDENESDPDTGEDEKETWVRICILTDNIGAAELVFRIYEETKLDMRFYFSENEVAKEFGNIYVNELKNSMKQISLQLGEISVGSVTEGLFNYS